MVQLVKGLFKPKNIYLISDPDIAKGDPHYRICLSVEEGVGASFACCTRHKDKQLKLIKAMGEKESTLVQIDHLSKDNNLSESTFVNCNSVSHYEDATLEYFNGRHRIIHQGVITDDEYELILRACLESEQHNGYFKKECNDILHAD